MTTVFVLANCQSVGLAHAIKLMVPGANAVAGRVHLIQPANRAVILDKLSRADLILMQELRNFGELNTDHVKSLFPEKTISIPNIYYRDFHPDACYIGPNAARVTSPIGDYHSAVVLDSFLRGHSEQECAARFNRDEFARLGLLPEAVNSLAVLEQRDKGLDVPVAPIIRRYQDMKTVFMYTINHPKAMLMKDVAEAALRLAGIKVQDYDPGLAYDNLMFGPLLAVHPFLSQSLGFDVNFQRWKLSGADGQFHFLGLQEFIAASYKIYLAADRDTLVLQSPDALKTVFS